MISVEFLPMSLQGWSQLRHKDLRIASVVSLCRGLRRRIEYSPAVMSLQLQHVVDQARYLVCMNVMLGTSVELVTYSWTALAKPARAAK